MWMFGYNNDIQLTNFVFVVSFVFFLFFFFVCHVLKKRKFMYISYATKTSFFLINTKVYEHCSYYPTWCRRTSSVSFLIPAPCTIS